MTTKVKKWLRFGVLLASVAALLGTASLTTATSAEASSPALNRVFNPKTLNLKPSQIQALAARATARTARGVLGALSSTGSDALASGEYPGFAYCGSDEAYFWPSIVASHQGHFVGVTRTHLIRSALGDFSDAVVESSPVYELQMGSDYYEYDIATSTLSQYGDTYFWSRYWVADLWQSTDYIAFVNEIFHIDFGSTTAPTFELLDVVGPAVTGPNVCQP